MSDDGVIDGANVIDTIPQNDRLLASLEGILSVRRGKKSGKFSRAWLQCYVVLQLDDGGSISCYNKQAIDQSLNTLGRAARELSYLPKQSVLYKSKSTHCLSLEEQSNPEFLFPSNLPWVVKNMNDATGFVVEIDSIESLSPISSSIAANECGRTKNVNNENRVIPNRVYFRCSGNEKQIWLDTLSSLNHRLSHEIFQKKGMMALLSPPSLQVSHKRLRNIEISRGSQMLEQAEQHSQRSVFSEGDLMLKDRKVHGTKEYLVYPTYAYPNRWMTNRELHKEMVKPSTVFHDLRKARPKQNEIGVVKIEVLQCLGLPRLDPLSETDAVVYLVVGSAAFATDVVSNRLNPIWLPKSRRACIFPVFRAFSCIYVGVFDDDGKNEKDDFAGRVVINLSTLRPDSVYDVTLPLRLSSHVYSRRPRGAIRLRFSLDWMNQRLALLSYLPSKSLCRPETKKCLVDDAEHRSILCADEKAFRNIATTVYGLDMPRRFNFRIWRATLREANFTRKVILLTLRKQAISLVLWKNPNTSFCVFCVYMRCIYLNSLSVVPAYLVFFLLLVMIRNYAVFATDGPAQNGFIPPSFEEMLWALWGGGDSRSISPIEMKPPRRSLSTSLARFYDPKPSTHVPKGKQLFGLLGFDEEGPDLSPEDCHMEFAWSRGLNKYSRFTVRDSLVEKRAIKKKNQGHRDDIDTATFDEAEHNGARQLLHFPLKAMLNNTGGKIESDGDKIPDGVVGDKRLEIEETRFDSGMDVVSSHDVIPEQNIDIETKNTKKLSEDLLDIERNFHKLTFFLFNDRTHTVERNARYFRASKKGELWRRTNVAAELDRLLNVGQYSSANPVVSRVGMFIMPMISAAHSGLCLSRAIYNIATWRDPMLSFWVTILLFLVVVVLFVFPWRMFFMAAGFILVGPQNWFLRVLHEHGKLPSKFERAFQVKLRKDSNRQTNNLETALEDGVKLPADQAIFSSHTSDGSPPLELSQDDVDPREVHAVSVPLSRLMYRERVYSWPPESQYSKIQPVEQLDGRNTSNDRSQNNGNMH